MKMNMPTTFTPTTLLSIIIVVLIITMTMFALYLIQIEDRILDNLLKHRVVSNSSHDHIIDTLTNNSHDDR